MASTSLSKQPLRLDLRRETLNPGVGSAHVSIELPESIVSSSGTILIKADCTSPAWTEQAMLYCGLTSTNKHLYTMLYEKIPLGPVRFRMRAGSTPILESDFYKQIVDDDGKVSNVVESWVFGDFSTLTPTESERPPLLQHEQTQDSSPRSSVWSQSVDAEHVGVVTSSFEPWRRHRRQSAISLPSPPLSPGSLMLSTIKEDQREFAHNPDEIAWSR